MSNFQTYLANITKKAQDITSKAQQAQLRVTKGKTRPLKLSKKDIDNLKKLKEQAKNVIPSNERSDSSFAKLAEYGTNFKTKTQEEAYQKAFALEQLTAGKILSRQRGGPNRRMSGGLDVGFVQGSLLQDMFSLNADAFDSKRSNTTSGSVRTNYKLLSKDRILNLLNDSKKQELLKKHGFNDYGINYLKSIFSDKELESKIFTYTKNGKKYFNLGSETIVSEILRNKNSPYYVPGFTAQINQYYKPEISDKALYIQKYIADYQEKNSSLKNILLLANQEKQLLNKYSDKLNMMSGVDLSGYNKLISEGKKYTDLIYSNLNEFLSKGVQNKKSRSGPARQGLLNEYIGGVDVSNLYRYAGWKTNANKYAELAEKSYKDALGQLTKILGVSSEQFDVTQKTQKETVKQITDILDSQKMLTKSKQNVAKSRQNAMDIAVSKDKPIYQAIAKKPVFTQRPS
jgi:hypothetical protein